VITRYGRVTASHEKMMNSNCDERSRIQVGGLFGIRQSSAKFVK
jgi:hypothetical protein